MNIKLPRAVSSTCKQKQVAQSLIDEAERVLLMLEQDDIKCGDLHHLRRAVKQAEEHFKT